MSCEDYKIPSQPFIAKGKIKHSLLGKNILKLKLKHLKFKHEELAHWNYEAMLTIYFILEELRVAV